MLLALLAALAVAPFAGISVDVGHATLAVSLRVDAATPEDAPLFASAIGEDAEVEPDGEAHEAPAPPEPAGSDRRATRVPASTGRMRVASPRSHGAAPRGPPARRA